MSFSTYRLSKFFVSLGNHPEGVKIHLTHAFFWFAGMLTSANQGETSLLSGLGTVTLRTQVRFPWRKPKQLHGQAHWKGTKSLKLFTSPE